MKKIRAFKFIVLALLLMFGSVFASCRPDPGLPHPGTGGGDNPVVEEPKYEEDDSPLPDIEIEGWTVTFRDEFNGNMLNPDKWAPEIGGFWFNEELQAYKKENATVSDGTLKITAKREWEYYTDRDGEEVLKEFSSARLRTHQKFSQTYGRFEAKIKIPAIRGLWPAFWMMPEVDTIAGGGWPRNGEIDIMEAKGRVPTQVGQAIHFGEGTGGRHIYVYNQGDYTFPAGGTIADWHVYRIDWFKDKMEWYVDDVLVYTVNAAQWRSSAAGGWRYGGFGSVGSQPGRNTASIQFPDRPNAPFDHDFHMLLNLAVGGHFDGGLKPPSDFEEASMEVDYVRVWQLNEYLID